MKKLRAGVQGRSRQASNQEFGEFLERIRDKADPSKWYHPIEGAEAEARSSMYVTWCPGASAGNLRHIEKQAAPYGGEH